MKTLCASLFAAAFISALAAERDPAVAAAPVWKCDQSSDMVIWRTEVASHTGPISLAGGKIFVGVAEPKIENPRPDRNNNYGAVVCLDEEGKILWRSLHERLLQRAHDIGQPI